MRIYMCVVSFLIMVNSSLADPTPGIEKFMTVGSKDIKLIEAYRSLFTGTNEIDPQTGEIFDLMPMSDGTSYDGCTVNFAAWAEIEFRKINFKDSKIITHVASDKMQSDALAIVSNTGVKAIQFYREAPKDKFTLDLSGSPKSVKVRQKALKYIFSKCSTEGGGVAKKSYASIWTKKNWPDYPFQRDFYGPGKLPFEKNPIMASEGHPVRKAYDQSNNVRFIKKGGDKKLIMAYRILFTSTAKSKIEGSAFYEPDTLYRIYLFPMADAFQVSPTNECHLFVGGTVKNPSILYMDRIDDRETTIFDNHHVLFVGKEGYRVTNFGDERNRLTKMKDGRYTFLHIPVSTPKEWGTNDQWEALDYIMNQCDPDRIEAAKRPAIDDSESDMESENEK